MTQKSELWRKACLPLNSCIQQAIENLDDLAIKIVLVRNEEGILEGTISDGDIRRGLLRGLDLTSPLSEIIHRNPFVVPLGLSRDKVIQLMTINNIQQIPIVNNVQQVVGLHLWEELNALTVRSNKLVIMAGGKGTRLLPYTQDCPKPLVKIAGKPMIEHIIERAKKDGFRHFILSVFYLGHMIEEYFGNGENFGIKIEYIRESKPLGTAGALSLLDPRPDTSIVVTNGDVITDIRYGELLDFHLKHKASATMAVRPHEWQHPFGVVHTSGIDIKSFIEKPVNRTYINAGVYVLDPTTLGSLVFDEHCDMPRLFENLQLQKERTIAYPMHEPWLDVGRPDDLASASNAIKST